MIFTMRDKWPSASSVAVAIAAGEKMRKGRNNNGEEGQKKMLPLVDP